jgi:glycosyltransferase involved in cell wall biosynthesis
MRIGINLLSISTGGAEIYVVNLIKNLALIDKENQYEVFISKEKRGQFEVDQHNFKFIELSSKLSIPYYRIIWEQFFLPIILKKDKIDVLFSSGNIDILFSPCKTVIAIQVIQPFAVPEMFPSKMRLYYLRAMIRLSSKMTDKIITVSKTTKNELIKYLNIPSSKIVPVYHGVDAHSNPLSKNEVKRKFGIKKDYILSISSVYKFKNYINLIRGFKILREKYNKNFQLVIVGKIIEKDYSLEMIRTIDELCLNYEVILIDGVPHNETYLLYSGANLYVFPSYCETFGMTQIEAMACGIPVVTSNISVMLEICGDAAVYFDPANPEDIADKMNQVLSDESVKNKLINNGLKRARDFSWEKSAREHLSVFEEVYRAGR